MTTQPFKDAQAAFPFVIAQGRNIEAQVYSKRYPKYNYQDVVPVVTEGNQWAIGTTFFTIDVAGQAKFLSGKGTDVPFVSSKRDHASHDFQMIGAGWEWTIEEVNQAALYNTNLQATDANTAAMAVDQLLYQIAMTGSDEKNWEGFVNSSLVSENDAAVTLAAATPAQAAAFVNDALSLVATQTGEVEYADTIAISPAIFRAWATKEYGDGNGTLNILEYIRKNNIYTAETGSPLNIAINRALTDAGGAGVDRMVAYRRDAEVLRFHLPMPRTVLAPRQTSLMGFEQGLIARTGGTEIRLPGAMTYLDIDLA